MPLLALLGLLACADEPPDGFYLDGDEGVRVQVSNADGSTVTLAERFVPVDPVLYAVDNDNRRYELLARHDEPIGERWAYLRLGEQTLKASAIGRDGRGATLTFDLDHEAADDVADLLDVSRADRTPLGEGVAASVRAPSAPVGGPAPVVVRIHNRAGPAVEVHLGGDERFTLAVRRDGRELPVEERMGFGTPASWQRLEPGDAVEASTDLARWVDLSVPGTYEVDVRYVATLRPPGATSAAGDRHRRWDLVVEEQVAVRVETR